MLHSFKDIKLLRPDLMIKENWNDNERNKDKEGFKKKNIEFEKGFLPKSPQFKRKIPPIPK